MSLPLLPRVLYEPLVQRALTEDLGQAGDVTTDAIIQADRSVVGHIVARQPGCIAGLPLALRAFGMLDESVRVRCLVADGAEVSPGNELAVVEGSVRTVLSAERTALNLVGHLSGVATVTRAIVGTIAGTGARVVCTRKTLPGLRALQKYAVRVGGGSNHRFGLHDAVLIKDNHLAIAGGVVEAVERVRRRVGHMVKVEVEVDTLEQLDAVLGLKVDAVLLDNMDVDTLRSAVARVDGRAITEASGGITPDTALTIAQTGVDLLSVGWITHSAPNLDVGLDIQAPKS